VVALRTDSNDNTLLWQRDPGFHAHLERAAEAATGADGRFRFSLPRGLPFDVEASTASGAEGVVPLRYAGEDVLVKLVRHSLHGRLTRASDGAPIAGALVRVFSWPSYVSREAQSGADGYRVTFPFDAGLWVEVLPLAEEATQWTSFELDASGEKEMDFVLADGVAVVGRVTEAGSGRPLAGAIVGEGWQFRRTAVTDAEGRYRLAGIGGAGAYGLAAKAKGHGMAKRMELPSVVDGALHVDFELPLAWSASGRVVDVAGAPVENALITAGGSFGGAEGQMMEYTSCRSDQDGRFRIEDLTRGRAQHGFTVRAVGLARHHGWIPQALEGDSDSFLGEIVLLPPVLVAGRVLTADGRPLLEAEVSVDGHDWRSTWTDALGRFTFGDLEPGSYRLKANWNSRPARPELELVLADGEIREGLELRVPRGETLSGRVIDDARGTAVSA
jgi:protocatechuate 3,4-dioxygenase beta subunit